MGRPKALLPCGVGGDSFLATLVTTLVAGGLTDLIVVGRPHDGPLEAELVKVGAASAAGIRLRYAENPGADAGQLSSVLAGLRLADRPGVRGLLWIPVDMPLVAPGTVTRLLAVFHASGAPIVRPEYRGAHGHPVIVARALFDELRRADPSEGARAVVRAHAGSIADVDVDDPGVVRDVDTPEDYKRLVNPSGMSDR